MRLRPPGSASRCASEPEVRRARHRPARGLAAAAALLACASACAGALDSPEQFAPELLDAGSPASPDAGPPDNADGGSADAGCNALTTIIAPTCATAFCHGSFGQQGGLDLQAPGLPHRLVGAPAAGGAGVLIDPAHPGVSVLYTKLLAPPPYGSQMPLLETPLSAADLACVQSWIAAAR